MAIFGCRATRTTVEVVVDMHRGGSLNNNYHFVSVAPGINSQLVRFVEEALSRRRVTPHFFSCEPRYDNQAAIDTYFTVTATWLASEAAKRDLAHITLAADARTQPPVRGGRHYDPECFR